MRPAPSHPAGWQLACCVMKHLPLMHGLCVKENRRGGRLWLVLTGHSRQGRMSNTPASHSHLYNSVCLMHGLSLVSNIDVLGLVTDNGRQAF